MTPHEKTDTIEDLDRLVWSATLGALRDQWRKTDPEFDGTSDLSVSPQPRFTS